LRVEEVHRGLVLYSQHDLATCVTRLSVSVRLRGFLERVDAVEDDAQPPRLEELFEQGQILARGLYEDDATLLVRGMVATWLRKLRAPGSVVTYTPAGRSARLQAPKLLLPTTSKITSYRSWCRAKSSCL
jgi:hypothetical protein